jgi:transposase-like protein
MKCPECGSTTVQELGTNAGDYNWYLCHNCGHNWPTERQAEIDRQRAAKE